MIPRFLHKLYAKLFGYFWLPCPKCGRMFGGHELSRDIVTVNIDGRLFVGCPKCARCSTQ